MFDTLPIEYLRPGADKDRKVSKDSQNFIAHRANIFLDSKETLQETTLDVKKEYTLGNITIVTQEVGSGYRAYLKSNSEIWKAGGTEDWAIGKLWKFLAEHPHLIRE